MYFCSHIKRNVDANQQPLFFLQERLAKRKEYFAAMDVDGNGTISFDEWLNYAYSHIVLKVAKL